MEHKMLATAAYAKSFGRIARRLDLRDFAGAQREVKAAQAEFASAGVTYGSRFEFLGTLSAKIESARAAAWL